MRIISGNILKGKKEEEKQLDNVSFPLHIHTFRKNYNFSFPHMSREKKWKLGQVVAKKQPQVVKIPPYMVHKH